MNKKVALKGFFNSDIRDLLIRYDETRYYIIYIKHFNQIYGIAKKLLVLKILFHSNDIPYILIQYMIQNEIYNIENRNKFLIRSFLIISEYLFFVKFKIYFLPPMYYTIIQTLIYASPAKFLYYFKCIRVFINS